MNLMFHSVDSENNKTLFKSEYVIEDNTYIFDDKSVENTKISLKICDDFSIIFKRLGNVNMEMKLSLRENTFGTYSSNLGLEFGIKLYTKALTFVKNKLTVEYDMDVDGYKTSHKIYILFS